MSELQAVVEIIKNLEPKPGRKYSNERTIYVEPDVAVRKIGDEYVIQLNEDGLPKLRISAAYRRMLRGGNGAIGQEAATYLKDKMRSAVWLIKSLDQRQRTIYKVADSIVRHQREFLDKGIEHLRPLVLRDVANDIGMHESTVSRVVSNKYIHTPRGPLPDEVLLPQRNRLVHRSRRLVAVDQEQDRPATSPTRMRGARTRTPASCSACAPKESRSRDGPSPSTGRSCGSPPPRSANSRSERSHRQEGA